MSKINSNEVIAFIAENLTDEFFQNNPVGKMSPFIILDFTFSVNSMDREIYNRLSKESRDKIDEENKLTENEDDIERLYKMLRKELNPITVNIIIDKLLVNEEIIIPKLISDLKRSGNDYFIESSARLFLRAKNNYSKELCSALLEFKYPYAKAVACYVMGKIGNEDQIETLFKEFAEFNNSYKTENYFEGPLFGLHEMKRRFEF